MNKYFYQVCNVKRTILMPLIATLGLLGVLCAAFFTVQTTGAHAASTSCSKTYTIVYGDTLGGIASRFATTVQSLASANGIADANVIMAGQQLCLANNISTTASIATSAQPGSGSTDINSMIDQVFGQYAASAKRIAMCESTMNPNAINSIAIGGSHAQGLFQILYPSTWNTTSQAASSPYNASANIHAAYEIFSRDGFSWREWACQP